MHFIFNILRGFEGEGQFAPPTAVAPAPRIFMIAVPQQALESVGVAQNAVMGLPMNCPGHITFIDGVSAEFDFVCPDRHLITGTIKRVEGKWRGSGNDSKGGPFEIEEAAPPPAR